MLRSLDTLGEGFQTISKKSKEQCGEKLENIRELIVQIIPCFSKTYKEYCSEGERRLPRYYDSLMDASFFELYRISGHILFLSCNGLYRNAFDNIRYALELIVQSLYIDLRHLETDLATKIEILREVEDKIEYHAVRLIDKLDIECVRAHKNELKREYKELSKIIHPSHRQVIATLSDIKGDKGVPATVNCDEIAEIYRSTKRMYDIFLFLFLAHFSEVKEGLEKNADFIELVKTYKLVLLSKLLKVRL